MFQCSLNRIPNKIGRCETTASKYDITVYQFVQSRPHLVFLCTW